MVACGQTERPDGLGEPDAGIDAGAPRDAATPDAGEARDAGLHDGGPRDAGEPDAGAAAFVDDGHYIRGPVEAPISDGANETFHLHVQRHKKVDGQWTNDPLIYDDGRTPADVFFDTQALWQEFYRDAAQRGMPAAEVRKLVRGIQSSATTSGVYVETGLGACGYNGFDRTITCGPGTGAGMKGTMAHESMHGWEWETFRPTPELDVLFIDLFFRYTNLIHHTRQQEPEKLSGPRWRLDYLNYGLQNAAEWGSETFRDWLYGPDGGGWPGNWQFMTLHAPAYEAFFDCLWSDGRPPAECAVASFGLQPPMRHPETRPEETLVPVQGFTSEDSEAIWKVCRGAADASQFTDRFDAIVRSVAPNLPGSPARHYALGFGDCNHDGTVDWLCWYDGPGPTGVGNGAYLWNSSNTEGAYTFIVSGRAGDDYAEYLPDPFLMLPSINGSLAQPLFREWQGAFGSCNGASLFKWYSAEWQEAFEAR